MCSAADDPSTYSDPPQPTRPRVARYSGDAPAREPASVALAVLGEMLTEAENRNAFWTHPVETLREARRRVAEAEARTGAFFPETEDDAPVTPEKVAGLLILHAEAVHGCEHTAEPREWVGMVGPRGEPA